MIIGNSSTTVKSPRPTSLDWLIAAALAVGSSFIYVRTLAPGVLFGDAGEFQTAAWRLGLSHATGYPLYMLLGSLWQHALAPFGVNPAAALNALSALFASLAVALMYLLLLSAPVSSPITRRLVAAFAASMLAVNATFWSQAIVAEVYTLHTLLLLALIGTLLHAAQRDPASGRLTIAPRGLFWSALLFGISLSHHAMTILSAPAILVYLFCVDPTWWQIPRRVLLAILAALSGPLLLYAYVPLRSGPLASPWYHQPLGDTTLTLYAGGWSSFFEFLTGRSIAVGFHAIPQAVASAPRAAELWLQHFGVLGLVLVALGIYVLAEERRPFLWLTAGIVLAQQIFNLFYAIGDIGVYYIPIYAIGVIWAGYGAAALSNGMLLRLGKGETESSGATAWGNAGALIAIVLFLLPLSTYLERRDIVDQSGNSSALELWEPVLKALPEGNAIIVSNDRNEIPPLFYLQSVDGKAQNVTALHPLMVPEERFADVGVTIDTALHAGRATPVYLTKPMPGLEVKFDIDERAPLVRVREKENQKPAYAVSYPFGGLTLLGFDWEPAGDEVVVRLYWFVDSSLEKDYTTSVQLFDASENRIAQSDLVPGGAYYPTSLWKPGETMVEQHTIDLALPPEEEVIVQISMYESPGLTQLAPPLRLQTPAAR